MADPEGQLSLKLAQTEERLLESTRQHEEVKLRLVKSDEALTAAGSDLAERKAENVELGQDLSVKTALLETQNLELAETTAYLAASAYELTLTTVKLQESNEYLLQRTAELEAANNELKKLMQQREDFVASLTHDLKNPLIGATKTLEMLLEGKLEEDERPLMLELLVNSHRTMLRLIWNMLEIYRHECGAFIPVIEPVNIRTLLKQCEAEFSYSLKDKNLTLNIEMPDGDVIFPTDRMLLRRVLINLLDNAVKFSYSGGTIAVTAALKESQLMILIADAGPGIDEEQIGLLFERFWQTRLGRHVGHGSGLGLFLCKQIVTALGGTIECKSTGSSGTKFVLQLNRDAIQP